MKFWEEKQDGTQLDSITQDESQLMSDITIRVENLANRYRIGRKEELHDTFGGAAVDFVRRPWQLFDSEHPHAGTVSTRTPILSHAT